MLVLSGTGLALAAAGTLVTPVYGLLSVPIQLYCVYPALKEGYHDLVEKRRITSGVLDLVVLPGVLGAGYFFASSVGILVYHGSTVLVRKTERASEEQLNNLFGEQPEKIWILLDGVETEVRLEEVQKDHIVIVNAGNMIPVDGTVESGVGSVDQRMLTGESQPTEVSPGTQVFAATILLSGTLQIRVEQAGVDTVAMRIGEVLRKTADYTQTLRSRGMVFADYYAPFTAGAAALALPISGVGGFLAIIYGGNIGYNMRVTAPISMLNFLSIAARKGILIKDARSFDLLREVDTIVFDKTGTLTLEQPQVANIQTYGDIDENELLGWTAAAEHKQTHPIARAILQAAHERDLTLPDIADARYEVGYGIKVTLADPAQTVAVGSDRFMQLEGVALTDELLAYQTSCQEVGNSLVMVAVDGVLAGTIELEPTIRPETPEIIRELREIGLEIAIISGDQELPTQKLAEQLGIDTYFANTLPENKGQLIEQLQLEGRSVCFVGDGINDTIALKKANVSISMQGATTAATDTAQIVLLDGNLNRIITLLDISRSYERNMQANLATTIVPGVLCIGAVWFMHAGVLTAVTFYNADLVAGLTSSMLPVLRESGFLSANLGSED
ncbi:MAG: heavy metal translocating P-type ATPase [Candidatus Promineifilaceae bacterium]